MALPPELSRLDSLIDLLVEELVRELPEQSSASEPTTPTESRLPIDCQQHNADELLHPIEGLRSGQA
jgi:hypothetical protein